MKCPNCGKEIANGSMFCVYCGVQIKKSRKPLFITLFIVIVLLALGGFGYYQYDKAKQERAAMEREMEEAQQQLQQAQQKQQENNNKMLNDKESYLLLVKDGDALLADKKYSESISKYNDALVYEQKYSGTGYASHFNSNVKAKISSAKQQQESDELAKKDAENKRLHTEVDKCLKDKDKGSSENVECTYSVKTVIMPSTTTYVESASSGVAQGGHEYVDLGLSVKWATCNVGASKPEDYGNYYAWGETSTKTEYTEDNNKTYGKSMGDIKSNSNYDAARANWGGKWRLPTKAEMQELIDKCTWTWTTQNGKNGYKVIGPNGNYIFLPAAGYRYGSSLYDAGSGGYYWSSTPSDNYYKYAYYLYFNSDYQRMNNFYRGYGLSVRPVLE